MARTFFLPCTSCGTTIFHIKVSEPDEKITIICAGCAHVQGTIEKANDPGTDECEGYHAINIEGVNF
jgi:hypothetical protein